jgi:uncharacterized protein (TIGR02594 family)
MRAILVVLALLSAGACTKAETFFSTHSNNPIHTASEFLGLDERANRTELRELMSVDPLRTEWCAAFVNAILELDGIPGSESVSDNPLLARSFLGWGSRVEAHDIQQGDIVVFPRGGVSWQGHVGFYVETTEDGRWMILGGNQDNTVSYALFSPNYAIGIRRYLTPDGSASFTQ